jgi:hypothetical protein
MIAIPIATAFFGFKSREDRMIGGAALLVFGFAGVVAASFFVPFGYD